MKQLVKKFWVAMMMVVGTQSEGFGKEVHDGFEMEW
jgi:hypothetical protein